MKTVKSEKIQQLVFVVKELIDKKALKKIVLSKPDCIDEKKSTITPLVISGKFALQIETFSKDNKAYHRNIKENFEGELVKIFSLCDFAAASSVGALFALREISTVVS